MEKFRRTLGTKRRRSRARQRKWKRGNADNHANFYIMGLGYYKSGASIRRELIQIWVHHCAPGSLAEFFKTFNGALPVLKINLQPENYFSRGVFYMQSQHTLIRLYIVWKTLGQVKTGRIWTLIPQLHYNRDLFKCAFPEIKQKVSLAW